MKIDIKKTKEYYDYYNDICDCDACKTYVIHVSEKYPKLKEFLDNLGVEITKPFETMWLVNEEDESITYLVVQYVIIGKWDIIQTLIIDNLKVSEATHYPMTNVKDEHFVINIENIIIDLKSDNKELNLWIH